MKAVICAAGHGSRLPLLTKNYPKVLLPVGERTIIEYMLDNLSSCGIRDVIIVVGYKAETVKEKIGNKYKNCNITYVYNEDYVNTQNIYSLWLARSHIKDGMIFFNGDIIFHKNILKNILTSKYPDTIIADLHIGIEEDSMKVYEENGRLVEIGKKISKQANGWAIGIYKLSQSTSEIYFQIATKLFENGHKNVSFVVPLQEMSQQIPIKIVSSENYKWTEIDIPEDYKKALKYIDCILRD